MFNGLANDFNAHMIPNCLIRNDDNSLSSFWSDEEQNDQTYYLSDGVKTRVVWITNYLTNEDFPIYVSIDDPLHHVVSGSYNRVEQELFISNEKDDMLTLDLSKLNLDDLLILLYRLQQRTAKNAVPTSNSTISTSSTSSSSDFLENQPSFQCSSEMSTLHSLNPTLSHVVQSSLSMLNDHSSYSHPINRRQSSLTLSNIADAPKQFMTTLAKPISSFHSTNPKHIHSPNDVVDKLLQSFHLRNPSKTTQPLRHSSVYTYQESEQHKAKVISNLLSTCEKNKSMQCFNPSFNK